MTNKSKIFPEKAPNLHITFVLCEYKNKIKHIFFQVFTMIFVTDGVTICNLLLSIVYKNPLLSFHYWLILIQYSRLIVLGPSSFVRCRWVVSISFHFIKKGKYLAEKAKIQSNVQKNNQILKNTHSNYTNSLISLTNSRKPKANQFTVIHDKRIFGLKNNNDPSNIE